MLRRTALMGRNSVITGQSQRGAALFISLVILLVLSVIGISAMRGGLLQSLMATNMQQQEVVRSAAESSTSTVWAIATEQQRADGSVLVLSAESPDRTFTGFIDGSGAITLEEAQLDDDGERADPVLTSQVVVAFLDCAPTACGPSSIVLSPASPVQCYAFRVDGNTTVGDTQGSVSSWLAIQGAPGGAFSNCAGAGGGAL